MLTPKARCLELVEVVVKREGSRAETLALAGSSNDLADLGGGVHWVALHVLPMVEDALGEGLASGVGAEISGEAERLVDGQESLDSVHGGTSDT